MIAWMQQYVLYILGAVIVALLISLGVQTVRLNMAIAAEKVAKAELEKKDAQLQAQLAAVKQLAKQGEELPNRVEFYKSKAAKMAAASTIEIDKIRKEKVPIQCLEAVKWASQKASSLAASY